MNITITKNGHIIEVSANFEQRVGHQKRVRFYPQNALEYAKKHFPDKTLTIDESCTSLTISNYREPLAGTWLFSIDEGLSVFKDMADKFEEKLLNLDKNAAKLSKKNLKKDKENEIINDD